METSAHGHHDRVLRHEKRVEGRLLTPLKLGLPFLNERASGFFGVFAACEFVRHVLFETIAVAQVHKFNGVHGVFRELDRQWAFIGDILCEHARLGKQWFRRDNFFDDTSAI